MACDAAQMNRAERIFILVLCLAAALRVLIFSAAFWRTHRFGNRVHVPDQNVQLAFGCRGPGCNYREVAVGDSARTKNSPYRIGGACPLRCNSDWDLDCLDKISVWGSHRIHNENSLAQLDKKTVRGLVAASDFHAAWSLVVLV
jgi:hypothetical protein